MHQVCDKLCACVAFHSGGYLKSRSDNLVALKQGADLCVGLYVRDVAPTATRLCGGWKPGLRQTWDPTGNSPAPMSIPSSLCVRRLWQVVVGQ